MPVIVLITTLNHRNKVSELIPKVSSTRLHAQFAKAREADGHYHEAARAYETAKDFDSAVRCGDMHYFCAVHESNFHL